MQTQANLGFLDRFFKLREKNTTYYHTTFSNSFIFYHIFYRKNTKKWVEYMRKVFTFIFTPKEMIAS